MEGMMDGLRVLGIFGVFLMGLGFIIAITPSETLRKLPGFSRLESRMWRNNFCNNLLELLLGNRRYEKTKQEWFHSQKEGKQ